MSVAAENLNLPEYQASVYGEPLVLPQDLYIPPDALEVFLETFSGPLDLLLYLIRKQNLNIVDIALAEITKQYMSYIDLMRELKLNLAADYLVMAATLAELKSRSLLPRVEVLEAEEEDPRVVLIRRLQAYEEAKLAAEQLDALPRLDREHWLVQVTTDANMLIKPLPEVKLNELLVAFRQVLQRIDRQQAHQITKEPMKIRERMRDILTKISSQSFCSFQELIDVSEGKAGLVVSFVAILELLKQSMVAVVQTDLFAPLYVKAISDAH